MSVVVTALVIAGCDDSATTGEAAAATATAAGPLDCGQSKKGAKRAVRTFFAILRTGDEQLVLDALATGGRFEWLNVGKRDGTPVLPARRGKRHATAAAVAGRGGLPIRVTSFMNIDRPSGTTDLGFFGKWKGRKLVGKGAIDCNQGRARVLSAAIQ